MQTPIQSKNNNMSPGEEHKLIKQLKQEWDQQYQAEISKKEERLEKLKGVVIDQESTIKNLQNELASVGKKHKNYEYEIKKLKHLYEKYEKVRLFCLLFKSP